LDLSRSLGDGNVVEEDLCVMVRFLIEPLRFSELLCMTFDVCTPQNVEWSRGSARGRTGGLTALSPEIFILPGVVRAGLSLILRLDMETDIQGPTLTLGIRYGREYCSRLQHDSKHHGIQLMIIHLKLVCY
jgi:hypothetical protein